MKKVGIIGVSGYAGAELARLLANHDQVEITIATSRQYSGQKLADVYPNLRQRVNLVCENIAGEQLARRADLFFTAVPHKTAMDIVPGLLQAGKKVVDLSADYRLRDIATYEKWYQPHSSPEYIDKAVYGLPELYRQQVRTASLTANTGCFPVTAILGLKPLLEEGLIAPDRIIIDAKTGTSGAGRAAQVGTLFCEVHDGLKAYKTGGSHRHIPEMEQELSILAGREVLITFTPHLLPISRGILSTIYAEPLKPCRQADLQRLYEEKYHDEPFVRICPAGKVPSLQHLRGSNYCDIGVVVEERTGRVVILSAIDNIGKGAAGQAVQNMNLMFGFDEAAGLMNIPCFP
ncbi:MAG: N-acetyl-gamma-glutamyl-phosphate reductase [Deltaproteobacteria bacterium]|nr:MAG: N-acetyl-gamma-glutamyl-phosphate reductase [Deltaproteobacteria bacterium]